MGRNRFRLRSCHIVSDTLLAAPSDPFLDIVAETAIEDHVRPTGFRGRYALGDRTSRAARSLDCRDGTVVSLYDDFNTCLDLCQDGIGIAGEFGVADVQRSQKTTVLRWRDGGLDRTRICDLLRVKQAL